MEKVLKDSLLKATDASPERKVCIPGPVERGTCYSAPSYWHSNRQSSTSPAEVWILSLKPGGQWWTWSSWRQCDWIDCRWSNRPGIHRRQLLYCSDRFVQHPSQQLFSACDFTQNSDPDRFHAMFAGLILGAVGGIALGKRNDSVGKASGRSH